MTDATPTRSAVLEMQEDRRAMHEGYVFLDEKCLLLAGEMLRELKRHEALAGAFGERQAAAFALLQAAVARHGLEGLQVYPVTEDEQGRVHSVLRTLMGVRLQDAKLTLPPPGAAAPDLLRSPEAEACRDAYRQLLEEAAPLAAIAGNLERLHSEYRRSVRRARALQDVLLPEADRDIAALSTRLEELEQEDAIWMRQGR